MWRRGTESGAAHGAAGRRAGGERAPQDGRVDLTPAARGRGLGRRRRRRRRGGRRRRGRRGGRRLAAPQDGRRAGATEAAAGAGARAPHGPVAGGAAGGGAPLLAGAGADAACCNPASTFGQGRAGAMVTRGFAGTPGGANARGAAARTAGSAL